MLNGKLEYEPPNQNTLRFNGTLKLKKDPKIENLNIDNFIPKGSKIRQTSWYSPIFLYLIYLNIYIFQKRIFGLVVYTGMNTKMMKSSRYNLKKDDFYHHESNNYTALIILLIFFEVIVSFIIVFSKNDE